MLAGKHARSQLIRECSTTVVSARLATVDQSWRDQWNYCAHTDLHFEKAQVGISEPSPKIFTARKEPPQGSCLIACLMLLSYNWTKGIQT